jgi:hypothetical protein
MRGDDEFERAFAAWVSDAVYAVSGIRIEQPSQPPRKWSLTCVKGGAAACQDGAQKSRDQATERRLTLVVTNKRRMYGTSS